MSSSKKISKPRVSDEDEVSNYMQQLRHPLKAEVELIRNLIKAADPLVSERIKWNAPSYHFKGTDFVTFNLRNEKHVHLVFHHPSIVKIHSPLLQGDYKDRRMMYFRDMSELNKNSREFTKILKDCVSLLKMS